MSIKSAYFDYLDHIGRSIPLSELHAHPEQRDAIAVRHDIDHDLDLALEAAHHEHARGIRATYFLLHSHDYWQDDQFILKCRQLEAYGHEVALHVNVLTEWMTGEVDDIEQRLRELLDPMRDAGITVVGTSAHGDRACYEHGFINYWIWRELRGDDPARDQVGLSAEGIAVDDPAWQVPYPADHALRRDDGTTLALWGSSMAEHGLAYDAMHVPVDHYWTDSGGSWSRTGDPLRADLSRGRHQILFHPHWWRGEKRLIFVLSTARSGSKWLANFVDRATSCRGRHEWTLNHRREGAGMVADKRTDTDFVGLVEDRMLAQRLIREAAAHYRKTNGDVLEANVYLEPFLHVLASLGDDVILVHLHRDARNVVRSLLNRNWYDTPEDRRHRVVPVDGWEGLNQLERCCWYYRYTTAAIMSHVRNRLRFETMVADESALIAWLEGLGIVVHPLLAAGEFSRRINASKNMAFPPYQQWPMQHRAALEKICGSVQGELGYAVDASVLKSRSPKAPSTSARRGAVLMDLDLTRKAPPELSPVRIRHERGDGGLVLTTAGPDDAVAYVLLARGKWQNVKPRFGIASDHWSYYVCRIEAETTADLAVRVFVLWYDADGELVNKDHAATLHADVSATISSFAVAAGSTHFALALHMGKQPAGRAMTLKSISLRSAPLGEHYLAAARGWPAEETPAGGRQ
jgi:hypothetical protein